MFGGAVVTRNVPYHIADGNSWRSDGAKRVGSGVTVIVSFVMMEMSGFWEKRCKVSNSNP